MSTAIFAGSHPRTPYSVLRTQYVSTLVALSLWQFAILNTSAMDSSDAFLGRTPDQWLARLESRQPQERAEAAWAIAQLAERNTQIFAEAVWFSELVKMVSDSDSTVRYWGIQGLQRLALSKDGKQSARQSAKGALQSALTDKAPAPRIAAAETLGLLGEAEQALPVLVEALSHPQDAVRIQAVAALERLGEAARPSEQSLRAATSDSSEYVKRISARALTKLDAAKK